MGQAKEDIKANGILINVRAEGIPFTASQLSCKCYRDSLKSLIALHEVRSYSTGTIKIETGRKEIGF
jgi:hypothetical protein